MLSVAPSVADNIRSARMACGLSMSHCAHCCDYSLLEWVRWERGFDSPSIDVLRKISKVLRTTDRELLGYDNEEYTI